MTKYTVGDQTVTIGGTTVEVPNPIDTAVEFGDIVAVLLDTGTESPARNNVWAFSPDGNLLWKAEPVRAPANDANTYVSLWVDEGTLWAGDWKGIDYELDPETGCHVDSQFSK